ncbi:MAG: ComF family protein [Spiribacter salinus]|uniref:ComF family protein n=1 Tax=Spiribacter salinus TaxID=1335746 RepID=A0A540VQI7_9GAMM|nr:MAG: ComF family protein [Spiribacter salinus]
MSNQRPSQDNPLFWKATPRWATWLDQLYSGRCRFCSAPAANPDLCPGCREDLPWITAACETCAMPLASGAPRCAGCLTQPPPFDRALALWRYNQGIDTLIRQFKLNGDLSAGRMLTGLAAMSLARRNVRCAEPLVPMPLHPKRRRTRGFNQSAFIANRLGPTVADTLARRQRNSPPQRGLTAAARQRNLRDAFAVQGEPPTCVTIIDDVLTTGASAGALARCLKDAGVSRVEVLVLARAI